MQNLTQDEIKEMVKQKEIERLVSMITGNGMAVDPLRLAEFLYKEFEELRGFPLKRLVDLEVQMAALDMRTAFKELTISDNNGWTVGKKIKK
jgi:uncharacterized coiled-coil protein SlyX